MVSGKNTKSTHSVSANRYISMIRIIALLTALALTACSEKTSERDNWADDDPAVSIINLIATPEQFDGKKVYVKGYAHFEFEGNALWLSATDFKNGIIKNAVWLDIPSGIEIDVASLQDRHVWVIGEFDTSRNGHLGAFSGTIIVKKAGVVQPNNRVPSDGN